MGISSWGRDFVYVGDGPNKEEYQSYLDKVEESFEDQGIDSNLTVIDATKYITDDNKVDLQAMLEDLPKGARARVQEIIDEKGPFHDPREAGASYLPASSSSDMGIIFVELPGVLYVSAEVGKYDPFNNAIMSIAAEMFDNNSDFTREDYAVLERKSYLYHEVAHHLDLLKRGASTESGADYFAELNFVQEGVYEKAPELIEIAQLSNAVLLNRVFDAAFEDKNSIMSKYVYGEYKSYELAKESAALRGDDVFMDKGAFDLLVQKNETLSGTDAGVAKLAIEDIAAELKALGITDPNERAKYIQAVLDPEKYGSNVDGMVFPNGTLVRDAINNAVPEQARAVLNDYVEASQKIYGPDLAPAAPKMEAAEHEQAQVMDASEAEMQVKAQFEGSAPTETSGDPSMLQMAANYVPGLQSIIPVPNSGGPVQNGPGVDPSLNGPSHGYA